VTRNSEMQYGHYLHHPKKVEKETGKDYLNEI